MPLPLPPQDVVDSIDTITDKDTNACNVVSGNSTDLEFDITEENPSCFFKNIQTT